MNKNVLEVLEVKKQAIIFNQLGGMAELDIIVSELPHSYELTLIFKAYDKLTDMIDCSYYWSIAFNIAYMRNIGLVY